jgi:hypothetical protein
MLPTGLYRTAARRAQPARPTLSRPSPRSAGRPGPCERPAAAGWPGRWEGAEAGQRAGGVPGRRRPVGVAGGRCLRRMERPAELGAARPALGGAGCSAMVDAWIMAGMARGFGSLDPRGGPDACGEAADWGGCRSGGLPGRDGPPSGSDAGASGSDAGASGSDAGASGSDAGASGRRGSSLSSGDSGAGGRVGGAGSSSGGSSPGGSSPPARHEPPDRPASPPDRSRARSGQGSPRRPTTVRMVSGGPVGPGTSGRALPAVARSVTAWSRPRRRSCRRSHRTTGSARRLPPAWALRPGHRRTAAARRRRRAPDRRLPGRTGPPARPEGQPGPGRGTPRSARSGGSAGTRAGSPR